MPKQKHAPRNHSHSASTLAAPATPEPEPVAAGPKAQAPSQGGAGCLLRIYWMLIGNFAMALLAVKIADPAVAVLSGFDVAFGVNVLGLLAARYLDVRCCHGQTVSGEPADMSVYRRYAIILLIVSVAACSLAHLVKWMRT